MIDGFYSFLGFPRLVEGAAIKKAIARGIQEGLFGYYSGTSPVLGDDGKYQIPLVRVRFNTPITEDEIDLESGFLMMPQAVPVLTPTPATLGGEQTTTGGGPDISTPPKAFPPEGPGAEKDAAQKTIEISFSADRNQLFTAWDAIANLADLAGKVTVSVRADSPEGFDKNKLQNGVLEPLRESDLIK